MSDQTVPDNGAQDVGDDLIRLDSDEDRSTVAVEEVDINLDQPDEVLMEDDIDGDETDDDPSEDESESEEV